MLPLQVPGGYQDSLSSNTELGRAVQDACDELDNLSNLVQNLDSCAACLCMCALHGLPVHVYAIQQQDMVLQEKESLTKASELLQKLGYKGSIFQDAPPSTKSDESKQPEDDA